jgi:hypothetical protein
MQYAVGSESRVTNCLLPAAYCLLPTAYYFYRRYRVITPPTEFADGSG